MKERFLWCPAIVLILSTAVAQIGRSAEPPVANAPDNVAAAIQRQVTGGQAIEARVAESRTALRNWYGAALDAVKKDAMSKGQLDGVLTTDQERDRLDRNLTAEEESKLPPAVRTMRKQYDQAREKLAAQQKAAVLTSLRGYSVTLETLEKRLTQKGDIDGAVAARKERAAAQEQLAALEAVRPAAAPTQPIPVVATTSPPPARATEKSGKLLANGSFEDGDAGWKFQTWSKLAKMEVDTVEKHEGKASLRIDNSGGDDSSVTQKVTVKPMTRYRLLGYIKTKDVEVSKGQIGANLCLSGGFQRSEALLGTQGWKKVSLDFESGPLDSVIVSARLGYFGNMAKGTAWFDDLSVEELGPVRKK